MEYARFPRSRRPFLLNTQWNFHFFYKKKCHSRGQKKGIVNLSLLRAPLHAKRSYDELRSYGRNSALLACATLFHMHIFKRMKSMLKKIYTKSGFNIKRLY